uniref:Oxidoreductase-like domain-containing protein n=1 Tax=Anas platyrhynchos TaxID=8839 RepID=A0A8B9QZ02_ANAPL
MGVWGLHWGCCAYPRGLGALRRRRQGRAGAEGRFGRDNSGEGGSDPSGSDHRAETPGDEGSETPFSAPPPDLEPPSNCCMSGCANCVWIQHVERLLRHYGDGGERALEAVERHVQDESIKMLLRTEIRLRAKKD